MSWRPHSRAYASSSRPQAWGNCDRCNFTYIREKLQWQYQWNGTTLQNLRILVCQQCLDKPQVQLRTIIIPPDPIPILNPRPEPYAEEVVSYIITQEGSAFVTQDGSYFITEIEDTPAPDPTNPVIYPP